jgi:hypothetical protein
MIFWLVLKLEIRYYRVMIPWRILVSFRDFFKDYIYAWWNIWNSIINFFFFFCLWKDTSKKNLCDTPPPCSLGKFGSLKFNENNELEHESLQKRKRINPQQKWASCLEKSCHIFHKTKTLNWKTLYSYHLETENSKLQTTLFVFIQPLSISI